MEQRATGRNWTEDPASAHGAHALLGELSAAPKWEEFKMNEEMFIPFILSLF